MGIKENEKGNDKGKAIEPEKNQFLKVDKEGKENGLSKKEELKLQALKKKEEEQEREMQKECQKMFVDAYQQYGMKAMIAYYAKIKNPLSDVDIVKGWDEIIDRKSLINDMFSKDEFNIKLKHKHFNDNNIGEFFEDDNFSEDQNEELS